MALAAINGTAINQSVRNGYVSYQYRVWNSTKYPQYDEDGNFTGYNGGYDYYSGTTSAIINGKVQCSNRVYANGTSIAKAGDSIAENWKHGGFASGYVSGSASPGTSGSGNGRINNNANSSKVYINGQLMAVQGSSVTTHLSTTTQLNSPTASRVYVG